MSTPLDGLVGTITAAMPPARLPRHRLDAIGARWCWLYPIAKIDTAAEVTALCTALKAHGMTGIVPQEGSDATPWARRWSAQVRAAGLDLVIGLGRLSAAIVSDALAACKAGVASGVMIDQEAWVSTDDSTALVNAVLRQHPDAADWIADCHYPCLTTAGPDGGPTGHGRIARAWAPLCGLRAPQCYWNSKPLSFSRDGWVRDRLAWARQDYTRVGGSTPERVRASVQLYRHSVRDHVELLLREGETGSVWLWDWREADASALLALRVVHALEQRGYRGPGAVLDYQQDVGGGYTGRADGIVGPITCAGLGIDVPAGIVWSHP